MSSVSAVFRPVIVFRDDLLVLESGIVEDARLTLNDVKQEQNAIPCSAFEVPAMKPANFEHDGFALEAKATHLHLTEHSRNISALSTKVEPATPPRWKSFERDFVPGSSAPSGHFKATHLKRQRSDCES